MTLSAMFYVFSIVGAMVWMFSVDYSGSSGGILLAFIKIGMLGKFLFWTTLAVGLIHLPLRWLINKGSRTLRNG